jgi:CBS domain-containing protein
MLIVMMASRPDDIHHRQNQYLHSPDAPYAESNRPAHRYEECLVMLEEIAVKEWMTSPALTIGPTLSVGEAQRMMKEYGVRRLAVVEHGQLIGIVTIGDVREASPSDASTLSIWELNYLWAQLTVDRVMTRDVLTVSPEASLKEAAGLMLDKKVSGLPVVDDDGQLVGIITESDIFRVIVFEGQPDRA